MSFMVNNVCGSDVEYIYGRDCKNQFEKVLFYVWNWKVLGIGRNAYDLLSIFYGYGYLMDVFLNKYNTEL